MKKGYLLALAALSLATLSERPKDREYNPYGSEPVTPPIPKGCKEYTFYGVKVVAISEKSARKKAKRLSGIFI